MKTLKALYLNHLFFYGLTFIGAVYFVSFFVQWLFAVANWMLLIWFFLTMTDIFLLYVVKNGFEAIRITPERLSNGDENLVRITLNNRYSFRANVEVIDEIPFQFQNRNFQHKATLKSNSSQIFEYHLRPKTRGEYWFGKLNAFVRTPLGLTSRRYIFSDNVMVPAYPSYIQMKKYDMMAFTNKLHLFGLKKIRRIGHTIEFEQIKEYVLGDDIRTINWKATSKKNQLMVNQFQDEKSQPVYQVIDTGRSMQMPFNEMSLLDYAINSALALSNIVLKKNDKAGMFTFSKKTDNYVTADRKAGQMQRLSESLYRIQTDFLESDFSRLYVDIKTKITQRSLIILYTNFETMDALRRQKHYLKEISRNHLLIVVFFENTELYKLMHHNAQNIEEIYDKVIAEKFAFEKRLIVRELLQNGIQSILTAPEHLTVETINKYLELKSRGMI